MTGNTGKFSTCIKVFGVLQNFFVTIIERNKLLCNLFETIFKQTKLLCNESITPAFLFRIENAQDSFVTVL